MGPLVAGFVLLFVAQQWHARRTWREFAIVRYGQWSYNFGLAALILSGCGLVVQGKASAAYTFVWLPPPLLQVFVLPLMFVAFVFVAASLVPSNLRRLTRQPLLWGIVLWAIAHVLTRENLASITLFGGCAVLALIELGSLSRRQARAALPRQALLKESLTVAVGGCLFLLAFYLHSAIIGVAPMLGSRGFS